MENTGLPEGQIQNQEPNAYSRFAHTKVHFLMPINSLTNPSPPPKEPLSYLERSKLGVLEGQLFKGIPVYTLPEDNPHAYANSSSFFSSVKRKVESLSASDARYEPLRKILNEAEENKHWFRGAQITEADMDPQSPQLNKLISIATYGLDYDPQHASRLGHISITDNFYEGFNYARPNIHDTEKHPEERARYSFVIIYKNDGIEYDQKVYRSDTNGVVRLTHGTLRDKVEGVIFIPWSQEETTNDSS